MVLEESEVVLLIASTRRQAALVRQFLDLPHPGQPGRIRVIEVCDRASLPRLAGLRPDRIIGALPVLGDFGFRRTWVTALLPTFQGQIETVRT